MRYEKNIIKNDRKRLFSSGSIDSYSKDIIDGLKDDIIFLKTELKNKSVSSKDSFTAEQFDDGVIKAVKEAITEIKIQHNKEIDLLNKTIISRDVIIKELINTGDGNISVELKNLIKEQSEKIEQLSVSFNNNDVIDSNRPVIEDVFIDPLEENAGKGLKSHLKVKEFHQNDKENIQEQVNELKNLLGK